MKKTKITKAKPSTAANAADPAPTQFKKAVATDAVKSPRKDRWPEAVMARGYTMVPSILLWGQGRLNLKPDEFNVLMQLVSHWWTKNQNPHPSKETIARRMGKDPRTIQRHITSLEKQGFLKRETRYKLHKGQDSNGYDLRGLVKKLREIAPEFERVSDQNKRRRAKAETK
jgi:biotin operon repressor